MSYWQLFYHAVWSTKGRAPLIAPEMEPIVFDFMRGKANELGGTVFAINGMPDHVHLVVAVPPRIALAEFIGQVKGVTSAKYNKRIGTGMPRLEWQAEYGVFSFDGKRLANLINYVENQKRHHAQSTVIAVLERWVEGEVRITKEQSSSYLADDAIWRSEMMALE